MAQGMRPGGLTAMAVVNFVFMGLSLMGVLADLFLVSMGDSMIEAEEQAKEAREAEGEPDTGGPPPRKKARQEQMQRANMARIRLMQENATSVYVQVGLTLIYAVLLLISGLGYIGQRRVMGKILGTITALLGIGSVGFALTYMPLEFEQVVNLVYPVLSVVLLNTVFRHDFVN